METKSIILPTVDMMTSIYKDLGMTEHKSSVDVKTLMEWMSKQPHLPNPEGNFFTLFYYDIND